jgi:AcrR family transcriptional regulator
LSSRSAPPRKQTAPANAPQPPRAAERIRASARELFYREGIRAVGVDEIVTRAGVTKPSLYRAFPSKDDLAAAYLSDYDREFWPRFEKPGGKNQPDARAQVLAYIRELANRAVKDGYRGCGLSNAAVEYPGHTHPARLVAETHKKALRQRLRELAAEMGARDPRMLGDALMLLIEGVYVTGQQSASGPAQSALAAATALIDASVTKPARKR